jgi:exopolysaccharide production protein ExoZ
MLSKKIDSLQALRAFAAISVVAHHSFRAVTVNRDSSLAVDPILLSSKALVEIGAIGVDLFFILSGFLMVLISGPYVSGKKSTSDFFIHRLIRVWPLYVIATATYLALNVAARVSKGADLPFDTSPLRLLSFLFVPSFNEHGELQPILGVGWTLNYEMLFYLTFAGGLLFARTKLLSAVTAILGILFVAGNILPEEMAASQFLSDPIVFEFLMGGYVARLYVNGKLSAVPGIVLLAAGLFAAAAFAWVENDSYFRFVVRGLPALAIFTGVLLLDQRIAWPKWLLTLGDASYSIYLFHILIVYQVAKKVLPILASRTPHFSAEIAATAAISVAVIIGVIIHFAIEKPITEFLHRRMKRAILAGV